MTLYDISMLNLVEVMKRENPSISLRSIINSIDAASNIKVSHCRTLFPCYNTTELSLVGITEGLIFYYIHIK